MQQAAVYRALGLSDDEYRRIVAILGREPSPTELAMFSVEWSEHCGYPRSKKYLGTLPREGKYAPLVGTDAGGIVIDGRIVVFKAESHNHPSQVEPRAGAATGVGGIVRDILSMGARPVALLDSLRFGAASDPMTAFYVKGVVDGIQSYGNCIGVPTVGGEVTFHETFSGNCLVNVMCVGVVEEGRKVMTSEAPPGHTVMYLGSRTGRDGIGGCSVLASREFSADDQKRPTVQIGDPFAGKCLIEATLEAIGSGAVAAMKDMGAAGLTCTTSEMAAAGRVGMQVDLDQVPRREAGMEPYEVMMSESQERMLAAVVPGREAVVREIFERWGLQASVLGKTEAGDRLVIREAGREVANMPVEALTSPDPIHLPAESAPRQARAVPTIVRPPGGWAKVLLRLLGSPNICSRKWIFTQYDHTVQTNTVVAPGLADAAVIRLPIGKYGLAVTMDCNPRYCGLDPYQGARLAVAEAARNLACVGAEAAGVTDCLNFGNPEKPDRFWQFVRAVEGVADACRALEIPVVSGNVSFYNESPNGAVLPTPTIGMVGVLEDVSRHLTMGFPQDGLDVVLLGPPNGSLGGSEMVSELYGQLAGELAPLDLAAEKSLHMVLVEANRQGLLSSAHDLAEGGLAVALAECCLASGRGVALDLESLVHPTITAPVLEASLYFGEAPSRAVVSLPPPNRARLEELARAFRVPIRRIGATGGDGLLGCTLAEMRDRYESLPDLIQVSQRGVAP